jgi:DNA-binding HxlR family transcriptional regulator
MKQMNLMRCMVRVMRCSCHAKVTYHVLLYDTDDGGPCSPSDELLAARVGASVRTVLQALKELEELHVISVEHHPSQAPCTYTLLDPSRWTLTWQERGLLKKHGGWAAWR